MFMNTTRVAIVLNSPDPIADIAEDIIIVADGGLKHLKDKSPIAVIGDFDSLGYVPSIEGVEIITHPVEKNATDGELALNYAKQKGYSSVTIYGVNGGRMDQILGNVNLLAYARKNGITAVARSLNEEIYFTDDALTLSLNIRDTVSILACGGDATVTATGLYYPLQRLTIPAYSSLGISNKATDTVVNISVERGSIIVVRNYSL